MPPGAARLRSCATRCPARAVLASAAHHWRRCGGSGLGGALVPAQARPWSGTTAHGVGWTRTPPPTPSSFWRVPEALTASGRCTAGLLWPAACSEWVSNPCFVLHDAPKLTELVSYIIKLLLSSTFSQRRLQSCLPSASIDVPPRGGCPGSCFA